MTTIPTAGQPLYMENFQLTAITCQRGSTEEQAAKSGQCEGYSIRAQRQANHGKADELDAKVVEEFVDPGHSGRTLNRPDLQRMSTYIRHNRASCPRSRRSTPITSPPRSPRA